MCGIFGILHFDGRPAEHPALRARLSIIDLAGGHQPLSNGRTPQDVSAEMEGAIA